MNSPGRYVPLHDGKELPKRMESNHLFKYSKVKLEVFFFTSSCYFIVIFQVLVHQLGPSKPAPLHPCPNITWSVPVPYNGSSVTLMWRPQRHLTLNDAEVPPLRHINSANSEKEPVKVVIRHGYSFQSDAFVHGLVLVAILAILYTLCGRLLGQRRGRSLRIFVRCCFGWWKLIQSKMGLTTEKWPSDITIHRPADSNLLRFKTVENKTAIQQPSSLLGFHIEKTQSV